MIFTPFDHFDHKRYDMQDFPTFCKKVQKKESDATVTNTVFESSIKSHFNFASESSFLGAFQILGAKNSNETIFNILAPLKVVS